MLTLTKHPAIHPVETIPHLKTKGVTVAIAYRKETVVGVKQEALKCIIETLDIFQKLVSTVHLVSRCNRDSTYGRRFSDARDQELERRLSIPNSILVILSIRFIATFDSIRRFLRGKMLHVTIYGIIQID